MATQDAPDRPGSAGRGEGSASYVGGDAPAATAPTRQRSNARQPIHRLRTIALLLLGPLLVLAIGAYFYVTGGRYVSTENAYVKAQTVAIGTELPGRIAVVLVRSNQRVDEGQPLFAIDDRPYRLALDEAAADLADVRNEIEALKASYQQKREELALARRDIEHARSQFGRQQQLLASSAVSRSRFDTVRRDLDVARLSAKVIESEMARLRAQLAGDPAIPAEQHPKFSKAAARRDRAALNVENTVVRAPFPGVANDVPNLGRLVSGNGPLSAPVMSIVGVDGFWIEANLKETELTHVQPGQAAEVEVDAYPGHRWQARVESISQATGAEFAIIPPQNATGNWVKVVQRVPVRINVRRAPDGPALRSGMSATVRIDIERRRPLPAFLRGAFVWFGLTNEARTAGADG